uniref:CCR4-NOT transcription complex subunit 1 n=1 Tax=Steinernema glaseri TaxID=37863 RepID=A0A1I7ZD78_9BILA
MSAEKKDTDCLTCIIQNLFNEYQHFKNYPPKELGIVADIYGGMIREHIIEQKDIHIASALKKIAEAFNFSSDLKTQDAYLRFGITAIGNIKMQLHTMSPFCEYLMRMAHYNQLPDPLKQFVVCGSQRTLPPQVIQQQIMNQQQRHKTHDVPANLSLSAPNVEALVRIQESNGMTIKPPPVNVVEQVSFFFNNLSLQELPRKVLEMNDMIASYGEHFMQWLAQQLVVHRVLSQYNFIPLYANFVEKIANKNFEKFVFRETFRTIKMLLKSDKRAPIASSPLNDRQHLKSLGNWLGHLTIVRSKPIVKRDLDIKSLLLEASLKGEHELNYAVPFVAKLFRASTKSEVFHPNCAWVRPILGVLAEIHSIPNVKNNLKFEIELLCNDLHVDLRTLTSESSLLKEPNKLQSLTPQLYEPPLNNYPPEVIAPNYEAYGSSASSSPIPQSMRPEHFSSRGGSPHPVPISSIAPSSIPPSAPPAQPLPPAETDPTEAVVNRLTIYPHLALFRHHPHLKDSIKAAYRQFVGSDEFQKMIHMICRRSIQPSIRPIEELIRKDFAFDPKAENLTRSATEMSKALSAATAQFEFKCHLISLMYKVFRDSLNGAQVSQYMADEAANKLAEDNVETITGMILDSIANNTSKDVLARLNSDIESRMNGTYRPDSSSIPPNFPEQLRNNPMRTMKVYQDFIVCRRNLNETRPYDPFSRNLNVILTNLDKVLKSTDTDTDRALQALRTLYQNIAEVLNLTVDIKAMGQLVQSAIHHFLCGYEGERPTSQINVLNLTVDIKAMGQLVQSAIHHFLCGYDGERPTSQINEANEKPRWSQILREVFSGLCKCIMIELLQQELIQAITRTICILPPKEYALNQEAIAFLLCSELLQPTVYDAYLAKQLNVANQELYKYAQLLFCAIANNNIQMAVQKMLPECSALCDRIRQRMVVNRDPLRIKAETIVKKWREYDITRPETGLLEWQNVIAQCSIQTVKNVQDLIMSATRFVVDQSYDVFKAEGFINGAKSPNLIITSFPGMIRQLMETFKERNDRLMILRVALDAVIQIVDFDHRERDYDLHGYPYDFLIKSYFKLSTESQPALVDVPSAMVHVAEALHRTSPLKYPRFAFGWFNVLGNGEVMERYLEYPEPQVAMTMRNIYAKLLQCQLLFLQPFMRDINIDRAPMEKLLGGTNLVMYFISHVYPTVFYEHHHTFCNVIPPNCFHLRTCVLAAAPVEFKQQNIDPYDLESIVSSDLMKNDPVMSPLEWDVVMKDETFLKHKPELDNYLDNRTPVDYLTRLRDILKINNEKRGKYNMTLLNTIVLYVGMEAIKYHRKQNHDIHFSTIGATSYMDVLQNLSVQFCNEGRYLLFNAMANQLRYPNSQTNYFSMALLYIFRESTSETVQEQIARALFERAVCRPPHPWGVVTTLAHLVNDEQYAFWSHDFANCASEISGLFQQIRKATGQRRRQQATLVETINTAADVHN